MTAKQKAAREKFKAVVKEAAKLRKKNPKLTQAQAVKQAFAISYSKKGKKLGSASRQTGTSDKKRDEQRKAKKPGKRKSGPGAQRPYYYEYRKNRTDKPGKLTGTHKDTKSHNVNIRVVSGMGSPIDDLNYLLREKKKAEEGFAVAKANKNRKGDTKEVKEHYAYWYNRYKNYIKGLNQRIAIAKKHIK